MTGSISYAEVIDERTHCLTGIVLLTVPVAAAYRGQIATLQSVIAEGFGLADLVALFLFQPLQNLFNLWFIHSSRTKGLVFSISTTDYADSTDFLTWLARLCRGKLGRIEFLSIPIH